MKQYEAQYRIAASIYVHRDTPSGGVWMQDPEPQYKIRQFTARNNQEAVKKAKQLKQKIRPKYSGSFITIERLVHIQQQGKIRNVNI